MSGQNSKTAGWPDIAALREELTFRFEQVIFLPTAHDFGSMSDPLEEFLTDHDAEELSKIFGKPIGGSDDEDDAELLLESLHGFEGWIVQVAAPVYRHLTSGGRSFSWNHYHTEWLYADNPEGLLEKVRLWIDEVAEADRVAHEKKSASSGGAAGGAS